jgi:hypothetical protein
VTLVNNFGIRQAEAEHETSKLGRLISNLKRDIPVAKKEGCPHGSDVQWCLVVVLRKLNEILSRSFVEYFLREFEFDARWSMEKF